VILVRHGETVFNVLFGRTRRDPGVRDPRLTERGREQAAEAARTLAENSITRVIASPYTRAIQTAHVIARRIGVPVEIETAIRERYSYACDIGTSRGVLAVRWPDYDFDHIDETWWPDREEPQSAFEARCAAFRRRMAQSSDWRTTAVVTHWGVVLPMP
jgi:broad specificity phosphatase PhoE